LQWPRQQIPNRSAWNKWSLFLQHFHHNDILSQPLGPWLSPTHQHWTWFTNLISDSIYHYSIEDNQWSIHLPLTPPFHQYPGTRQARLWYSTSHSEPCQPPTATQPTSITFHTNASFHSIFAGTFVWVLATQDKQVCFRSAGPVDCHPKFISIPHTVPS
jgi:hypothetical protein